MTDFIQVHTTTASKEDAERIAAALVERRLAACVQIVGPITSVYRWQGKTETSSEWLCVAKTQQSLYGQVEAAIRELHSYEVPEIVATPIVAGSENYLNWVREETT
jgi:periplasmic divalent cation tolerance protein